MIGISEYLKESRSEISFPKGEYVDLEMLFDLKIKYNGGSWHQVNKIEFEDESIFGEEPDSGMRYCTIYFGNVCKTKQISNKAKLKEKRTDGYYKYMPTPYLLGQIVQYFGGVDNVTFNINHPLLRGVDWKKLGCGGYFVSEVNKTYEESKNR